jgi:lysophospholipase L1-like esterase
VDVGDTVKQGRQGGIWCALLVLALAGPGAAAGRRPRRPRPTAAVAPPAATPIENPAALAPFLEALDRLAARQVPRVRVLQFGDSHTAADYWSGRIRARLQARFGDAGSGIILSGRPWRGYTHAGVSLHEGLHWPAQSLRSSACDGLVGLPGASVAPVPDQAFTLQAAFGAFRVHLLVPSASGSAQVLARVTDPDDPGAPAAPDAPEAPNPPGIPGAPDPVGKAAEPVPVPCLSTDPLPAGAPAEPVYAPAAEGVPPTLAAPPRCTQASLQILGLDGFNAETSHRLALTLPEHSRLLGVDLLSGRPGLIYDELGLNGAGLLDLARWNPDLRRALLARVHPDLVVLAYGTNDMGMSAAAREGYPDSVRSLLQALRTEADAPILLIGPLDRLGRSKRQRAALKADADWIIPTLREACLATGCAFWDARQAMGGSGALLRWQRAGLAQPDLVHLNGAGYERLGDKTADAFLALRTPEAASTPSTPIRAPRPPARPAVLRRAPTGLRHAPAGPRRPSATGPTGPTGPHRRRRRP